LFAIIHAAGWPIYFLLAVSVIAVALIIERFMILRKEKIIPGGLLEKVLAAYQKQGVSEDMLEKLTRILRSPGTGFGSSQLQEFARRHEGRNRGGRQRSGTRTGALFDNARNYRHDQPADGLVRHRRRHDRDLRLAIAHRIQPQELAHGISVALYNTGFVW